MDPDGNYLAVYKNTWIFVKRKGGSSRVCPVFNAIHFLALESERGNCHYLFDRSKNILPHCSRFCFEPATQPGSFTIGTFLLLTAARFDAWRQQAARPRIVNVQNDSTE